MSQARSKALFNEARDTLTELGYSLPTYEDWIDGQWDGAFDDVRGLRQAADVLVPKIRLESGDERAFYMSFQPLRIANEIKAATHGEVAIANVHLDADEMVWEYEVNGVGAKLQGGKTTASRFVGALNKTLEEKEIHHRFVYAKSKDEGEYIVASTPDAAPALTALLRPVRKKKLSALPKGRHAADRTSQGAIRGSAWRPDGS